MQAMKIKEKTFIANTSTFLIDEDTRKTYRRTIQELVITMFLNYGAFRYESDSKKTANVNHMAIIIDTLDDLGIPIEQIRALIHNACLNNTKYIPDIGTILKPFLQKKLQEAWLWFRKNVIYAHRNKKAFSITNNEYILYKTYASGEVITEYTYIVYGDDYKEKTTYNYTEAVNGRDSTGEVIKTNLMVDSKYDVSHAMQCVYNDLIDQIPSVKSENMIFIERDFKEKHTMYEGV